MKPMDWHAQFWRPGPTIVEDPADTEGELNLPVLCSWMLGLETRGPLGATDQAIDSYR